MAQTGFGMTVVTQLLCLPIAWVGMLYMQQDSLIYHPREYHDPLGDTVLPEGMEASELRFATTDGNQSAVVLRQGSARPSRVYLTFGGNAMLARDWLQIIAPQYQHQPAWNSFAFVFVDYPGFGSSGGGPSQASIGRASQAALNAVVENVLQGDVEGIQLGALGHSIGCAAAIQLADLQSGTLPLDHIVLSAPFTSLASEAQEMMAPLKFVPVSLIALLSSRNAWDNLGTVERLAASPTRPRIDIIHGTRDSIVPHKFGQDLSEHCTAVGLQTTFKSVAADHNDLLSHPDFEEWLHQALTNELP